MARGMAQQSGEEGLVARVQRVIGEEAFNALQAAFGGRLLYVPREPGPHHPITAAIGVQAAKILGQDLAGERLELPLRPAKRARILQLSSEGKKVTQIAAQVGCTRRHVHKVIEAARKAAEPVQGTLF